jgi:hypothetical protein
MFFMNFPDPIIVRALNQKGYPIGLTQVVQIWKSQDCKQRLSI